MKKIVTLIIILLALTLTACTTFRVQKLETTGTDMPQVNMPNPASVYCTQQGNKLEIRTAADGSQSGVCVFPDGNTCDEWAYFRGECGSVEQKSPTPAMTVEATTEEIADWWGIIKSTPTGAQFDDYFVRQDLGQIIYFGIDSMDPVVQAQIVAQRDSGKIVHLYGTLLSTVPDYNGSQIQVDRIEVEG